MEPDKKEETKKSRHGKKSTNAKSKKDAKQQSASNESQLQNTVPVKEASSSASGSKQTSAQEDTAGSLKSRHKTDQQEKPPHRPAQQKSSSRLEKGRNTSKGKKNTEPTTEPNQPSASNDRSLQNTDPAKVTSSSSSKQKHTSGEEDTNDGWKYLYRADQQGKPAHRQVHQRKSPRHEKGRNTAKPKAQEDTSEDSKGRQNADRPPLPESSTTAKPKAQDDTSEGLKGRQKADRPPLPESEKSRNTAKPKAQEDTSEGLKGSQKADRPPLPESEKGRNNPKLKKDTEPTTDPAQPSTSAHVHQDDNTGTTKVRHQTDPQKTLPPLPKPSQSSTGTSKQGGNKTGNRESTQKGYNSQGRSGMTFPMTYYNSSSRHDLHGNTRPNSQPSTSHGTTSFHGHRDSWSYTPIEIAPRHLALRKYLSSNEGNWNQSTTNQSFYYNKNLQDKPNNNTYASHTKMYENTEYKQNKASYPLLPKTKQQEQSSTKAAGGDSKGVTYAQVTSRSQAEEESKPTKLKISKHSTHDKIMPSTSATASKELLETTSTKDSATASSSADTRTPSVNPSENAHPIKLPTMQWPNLSERRHVHFSPTTESRAQPEPTEKYRSNSSTVVESSSLQNTSSESQENWGMYDSAPNRRYNQHVLRPGAFPFYPPHAFSYYEPAWIRPAHIRSLPNFRSSNHPVIDWATWRTQRRTNVLNNYYLPADYSQIAHTMPHFFVMPNNQGIQYPSTTYYPYQYLGLNSTESIPPKRTIQPIQPIQQPKPAEQKSNDRECETGEASGFSTKPKSKKPDDDWTISAAFLSSGELLDSTPDSSSATSELNLSIDAGTTTNPFDIGLNIDLIKIFETARKNNSRLQPDQNSEFSLFNDSYRTRPGRFGPGISLADLELNMGWNISSSSTQLTNNRFNRAPASLAPGNRQVSFSNTNMYPTANTSRNPLGDSTSSSSLLPTSSDELLSDDLFNYPRYWEEYSDDGNQRRQDESSTDKSS